MDTHVARLERTAPQENNFTDNLLAGLAKAPKEIACKFFYDAAGSALFSQAG